MRYLKTAVASLSVMLMGTSFAASDLNGTYRQVGNATCIAALGGFDATDTAILSTGSTTSSTALTITGTMTFTESTGTVKFADTIFNISNGIVPGNPTANYFQANTQTLLGKYKFTTTTDGNNNTSVTMKTVGAQTGTITAGAQKGGAISITGAPNLVGSVLPSGQIVLAYGGAPVIQAESYNGKNYSLICNITDTLYPVP
ncbi:MAG TPA: hypothetical protein VGG36_01905 [Rhizomicrobium sp.]|jgi:hypothetical protein